MPKATDNGQMARSRALTLTAVTAVLLAACAEAGDDGDPDATTSPASPSAPSDGPEGTGPEPTATGPTALEPTATGPTEPEPPRVVASGLPVPWGVAPLSDGSALVTLREEARILRIDPDGGEPVELTELTEAAPAGEGGLLGIAVSPDDESEVFVYLTTAQDNRVLRLELTENGLEVDDVLLDGIPHATTHNGGRLAFGPDGYLYVTTGDAEQPALAQDPGSLAGKILRIDTDGNPAPGNPYEGSPVWSLGHRNVQGVAWDDDGHMYASEFGSNVWDELNLIEPGGDYGWPEVEGIANVEGLIDPLHQWQPADASPSGIGILDGTIYLAALRGESLWRVPLAGGGEIEEPERLLHGEYGRLRAATPDDAGRLWLLTDNVSRGEPTEDDDRVIILDPAWLD